MSQDAHVQIAKLPRYHYKWRTEVADNPTKLARYGTELLVVSAVFGTKDQPMEIRDLVS